MHLVRFRNVAVALGLVASQGCKPEDARLADKAAEHVNDNQAKLRDLRTDEGRLAAREVDKSKDLVGSSKDLATAAETFELRRDIRIQSLRAVHDVIATQSMLINGMAQAANLTDSGRAAVDEKLQLFVQRVDDAGAQIKALGATPSDDWKQRDDAVGDAMKSLDDARGKAWRALQDAPRTDRSS